MTNRLKTCIVDLLAQPEVQAFQGQVAEAGAHVLRQQGILVPDRPSVSIVDTGVGAMRRIVYQMQDPLSGSPLELLISVLAKIDGTVSCWAELWSQPSERGPVREMAWIAKFGKNPVVPGSPRRLRLARQNLVEGKISLKAVRDSNPLSGAYASLQKQGFTSAQERGHRAGCFLAQALLA